MVHKVPNESTAHSVDTRISAVFERVPSIDAPSNTDSGPICDLETLAKSLPDQLPQIGPLNRLHRVCQVEHIDSQSFEDLESMIDCGNWNERNFFEKALLNGKSGIIAMLLERTAVGSIVELKFGGSFENQEFFTQKVLMIENAGKIEHIEFMAPHEEWSFYTDLGEKRDTANYTLSSSSHREISACILHEMQGVQHHGPSRKPLSQIPALRVRVET
ncbi:hypothetical protein KIN20_019970 [Parelaphostrongylus tenuis]|uniref:Uncharacterized protein n=1 Tax=Parelaphostrongylus tenuis TaxID=148309 RepID=A0AAD5N602_PARTN|nr:hypothetical protein KIN20_019970 [Parelaphostrongylus tenuis]